MTFAYVVSGFTLVSEQPLPFLVPATTGAVPDIEVRFASVPEGEEPYRVIAPDCVDLIRPGVLRVRVEQGRRMTVDAAAGTQAGEIQTYLFGPAFAALLYQRGLMPLHAAGVRVRDGDAVAIAGASRAGKSTTAWTLLQAGHSLLSDDQIVFDPHTGLAQAGFPAMKLWRATLAHFGQAPDAAPPVMQGIDKFHMAADGVFDTTPARLRAVCVLLPDPAVGAPGLVRLGVPEAVATLGLVAHHAYLADAMGRRALVFRSAAALAARVPVFLLRRPVDLGQLDGVVACVREAAGR